MFIHRGRIRHGAMLVEEPVGPRPLLIFSIFGKHSGFLLEVEPKVAGLDVGLGLVEADFELKPAGLDARLVPAGPEVELKLAEFDVELVPVEAEVEDGPVKMFFFSLMPELKEVPV